MSLCDVIQGIFYFPTKRRLAIAKISSDSVSKLRSLYLVIIDEDHNCGVGGHFLYSIKVSDRINGD